jgi:hypothetical protein
MIKSIALAFSLASLPFFSNAEYRAFLLEIKSADGQNIRYVKSNLDPLQYPAFYPLREGESIAYRETWMCNGRTSNQPPCKSPKELATETAPETETRQPASEPKN